MLCTEMIGDNYIRTYSDDGYEIRQVETGKIYGAALDKYPCKYTYEETPNLREGSTNKVIVYEKIINILTGDEE